MENTDEYDVCVPRNGTRHSHSILHKLEFVRMTAPNGKGAREEESKLVSLKVGKKEFSMGIKGPLTTPWPKL